MDFLIAMDPAVKCLLLLLVVAILFVTEKIPLAVTSIASAVCCWLLGLVPLKEVFLGLADSTVVLFGGMFVVGAAMFYTGLAQDIGARIVKVFGTSETKLMIGVMIIAAVMSAFLPLEYRHHGLPHSGHHRRLQRSKSFAIPYSHASGICCRSRRYLHTDRYTAKHHCKRGSENRRYA